MAVWSNLRRALTSSFGSICLGSLLVAIVKTLRQVCSIMSKTPRLLNVLHAVQLLMVQSMSDLVANCRSSWRCTRATAARPA